MNIASSLYKHLHKTLINKHTTQITKLQSTERAKL